MDCEFDISFSQR